MSVVAACKRHADRGRLIQAKPVARIPRRRPCRARGGVDREARHCRQQPGITDLHGWNFGPGLELALEQLGVDLAGKHAWMAQDVPQEPRIAAHTLHVRFFERGTETREGRATIVRPRR